MSYEGYILNSVFTHEFPFSMGWWELMFLTLLSSPKLDDSIYMLVVLTYMLT